MGGWLGWGGGETDKGTERRKRKMEEGKGKEKVRESQWQIRRLEREKRKESEKKSFTINKHISTKFKSPQQIGFGCFSDWQDTLLRNSSMKVHMKKFTAHSEGQKFDKRSFPTSGFTHNHDRNMRTNAKQLISVKEKKGSKMKPPSSQFLWDKKKNGREKRL